MSSMCKVSGEGLAVKQKCMLKHLCGWFESSLGEEHLVWVVMLKTVHGLTVCLSVPQEIYLLG